MSNVLAPTDRPFALVVGIDLADTASGGYALDQATRIAMRIPDSHIHVLHVARADAGAERTREVAELLRMYVSEKATALGGLVQQSVGIHVRRGDAAQEIAQLANEVGADMIVVGTHKAPHLKNLFVGSTAERVMSTAKAPVVVAGPRPQPQPSHVITIEPPCPDCVEARVQTKGRGWWCARHSENHHLRRHHVYSYQTHLPFSTHDSEVTATGTD